MANGVTFAATGATFGGTLSTAGLGGSVPLAPPADACGRVDKAVSGKAAIVDRGTVWRAFAAFGVGVGARGMATDHETFTKPSPQPSEP